jgi:hypothetical protein
MAEETLGLSGGLTLHVADEMLGVVVAGGEAVEGDDHAVTCTSVAELSRELSEAYIEFGLAGGPKAAAEAIRGIERQVAAQVRGR